MGSIDKKEYHKRWQRKNRYGIPPDGLPDKICPACGKVFHPNTRKQIYHNKECGNRYKLKLYREQTAKRREEHRLAHMPYRDGDIIIIPLTGRFEGKNAITDYSSKNYSVVKDHIFGCDKYGYPMTTINGKMVHLHHLIVPRTDYKLVIDHINGDKLDARESNLREVKRGLNNYAQPKRKHNTTGTTGVYYEPNPRKGKPYYYARIHKDGVTYNLGHFFDKKSAVEARLNAELKYYGEYSNV